jgi:formate C-acetyltransferase
MASSSALKENFRIREPEGLSPRIKFLRDYYFEGARRKWNNETTSWTTGTPWDIQYNELTFYIVPETYTLMQTIHSSYRMAARKVDLPAGFWKLSIPERRAWFTKEVMVKRLPHELLPGDLIAGARFNIMCSHCLTEKESGDRAKMVYGKKGARAKMKWFHDHGYGNSGATSGHLIPWHQNALTLGWKGINNELNERYDALSVTEKKSDKGAQLKAMLTASEMARDLAEKYSVLCSSLAENESDSSRADELRTMASNLKRVPWEPPSTFWEAVQALWLNHMLVMSDENYPGPGVSFGRIDQYLLPYWDRSLNNGMDREFGKEILRCFWVHANTAYDSMIRTGNQGITAGFGQLITLAGMGPDGKDLANDLTYAILEVIDEMSPILEPKPNVRLHRNSPDRLLDKLVDMISNSQGAPFLLNFDERSIAGMILEGRRAGIEHLINEQNAWDYAPVGCLENTMAGNDRSGTVDNNLNLLKAVELAMNAGKDIHPFTDPITGKTEKIKRDGPDTGSPEKFRTFGDFWNAYKIQTVYIIRRIVNLYEESEKIRAQYHPTPYLSCLVKGCAEKAVDITRGGAEISLTTLEAVTFATTVDSLLAVKYLVFDKKICSMAELLDALKKNWEGYDILRAHAKNKAPKYGRDDDAADAMALKVMELWTGETWKHSTRSTGRRFRPGMLSWNYWAGDGYVMAASPDGRARGQFLSNAICPSNGADINGPTANANSVGKALGGKLTIDAADSSDSHGVRADVNCNETFMDYINLLPNGASHTITFNPAIMRDTENRSRFKAFLRGYAENGGTALQINILDPEMLREAQKHPKDYRHLLVRITGYNAYFTGIGRELQDEVIARLSHSRL